MLAVITIVVLVYGIAVFVDWALTTEAIQRYRDVTLDARRRLSDLDTHVTTQTLNAQFQNLFEAIYTPRFFSAQRLLRSAASSIAAVTFLLLVIALISSPNDIGGFLRSAFVENEQWGGTIAMLVINLFADYVSLQETSWILRLSQGRRLFGLILWTIVDLTLTVAIYAVVYSVLAFSIYNPFDVSTPSMVIVIVCLVSTFFHVSSLDRLFRQRARDQRPKAPLSCNSCGVASDRRERPSWADDSGSDLGDYRFGLWGNPVHQFAQLIARC